MPDLLRMFEKALGDAREVRQDEYDFRCPFCPDKGKHLGVNLSKKAFNCLRCGAHGNLATLLKRLTVDKRIRLRALGKAIREAGSSRGDVRHKQPRRTSSELTIPGYRPLPELLNTTDPNELAVLEYAEARGLDFHHYNAGLTPNLKGRLVFPVITAGVVTFYQARAVYSWIKPKVLGPSRESAPDGRARCLWNLDAAPVRDTGQPVTLFLSEGIFDAVAVERLDKGPALAALGRTLTDYQCRLLDSRAVREIVVVFDGDANAEAARAACKLDRITRPSIRVSYVVWPDSFAKLDPDGVSPVVLGALVAVRHRIKRLL